MKTMSLMTEAMPERQRRHAPLNTQTDVEFSLHRIDIQWGVERDPAMPEDARIAAWVQGTLKAVIEEPVEVTIRVVNEEEMTELNGRFRETPKPTNVLSFPVGVKDEEGFLILGDVVLCDSVVVAEAGEQHKSVESHFAHMVVHGVLHLKGYDHVQEHQAEQMESLERNVMDQLGFPDPWQEGVVNSDE